MPRRSSLGISRGERRREADDATDYSRYVVVYRLPEAVGASVPSVEGITIGGNDSRVIRALNSRTSSRSSDISAWRALQLFLTPIALHYPNDLLVFLGFAYLKLGRNNEAASYLKRALDQRPDDERLEAVFAQAHELAKSVSKP